MSDPSAPVTCRRRDLLLGVAGVLLLACLGMAAFTRAAPSGWQLGTIGSGRVLVRHAIVGGLMLLGPIGAELLLVD